MSNCLLLLLAALFVLYYMNNYQEPFQSNCNPPSASRAIPHQGGFKVVCTNENEPYDFGLDRNLKYQSLP